MKVAKLVVVASDTTFVSPFEHPGTGTVQRFFYSFIVIAPKYPILQTTLYLLLKHYQEHGFGVIFEKTFLSSGALFASYKNLQGIVLMPLNGL